MKSLCHTMKLQNSIIKHWKFLKKNASLFNLGVGLISISIVFQQSEKLSLNAK